VTTTGRPLPPGVAGKRTARVSWISGAALRLHAALLAGLALAGTATWLEWTRARDGHAIAWVYTFEWPLFAVLGTYLWWRLLHADAEPAREKPSLPDPEETSDPGLLAWQAYLDRLHAVDPPGGPPAGR
jgi:hypothetical protein